MKIKIEFMSWTEKEPLEFEADNIKDAVEAAIKNSANLYGADLSCANLYGAKHNKKELWNFRPILQLGPCGSVGRSTIIYFYADKSEPLIRCGCFGGNIAEFEAIIHQTHAGTFFEYEYMTMVEHIKSIYKYQLEGTN